MTLAAELNEKREQSSKAAPAEVLAIFEDNITEVTESGIAGKAINVGDQAPDFTLPDASGGEVKLSELLANGPVVISFYRGGWCPYCNLELRALQAVLPEITAAGGSLVAISPEKPDESLSTKEKGELDFGVLSDAGSEVIRSYGLVFTVDGALKAFYEKAGRDLAAVNGSDKWELPVPATYVIGTDGIVSYAVVDADYRNRAEPAEVVAAVQQAS